MKPKAAKRGAARLLRRGVAGILALAGVGMAAVAAGLPPLPEQATAYLLEQQTQADAPGGQALSFWQRILLADSALLAQAAAGHADSGTAEETTPPEEIGETPNLSPITPDKVEERTLSGSGTEYVNAQGISLFNRTEKTVDLAAFAQAGSSLHFQPAEAGPQTLILHTHCTTGMAYMTVTKAIESGIDVIDCATSCFSNGTSQPSTETMFYALGQYGIETGLNEDVINKVNDYFKPIKQKYVDSGRISAKSMATDAQALVYKVPGGMLSNMIANLTDMKAMDKFDAALKEIPEVRKDLGYPPLVTPLSQMVGNQAVTNVLMGERYKIVSKEVQNYFRGQYGIAPAPVSESLQAKILGEGGKPVDCRIEDAKRTGEDFKKAKEALGDLARSEEDVMSYICYPDQAMKFFEDRKAKEENICTYVIEEA